MAAGIKTTFHYCYTLRSETFISDSWRKGTKIYPKYQRITMNGATHEEINERRWWIFFIVHFEVKVKIMIQNKIVKLKYKTIKFNPN